MLLAVACVIVFIKPCWESDSRPDGEIVGRSRGESSMSLQFCIQKSVLLGHNLNALDADSDPQMGGMLWVLREG